MPIRDMQPRCGWRVPDAGCAPQDDRRRDARFRALREGPFVAHLLRQAPLERFWLSDLRRCYLFLNLMAQSGWMRGGNPGSFPFALVALRAQLSVARAAQLLDMACAAGDFRRERDPRDARQYVFGPSDKAIALFERVAEDLQAEARSLLGLEAWRYPHRALSGPELRVRVAEPILSFLDALDLRDRGVGSLCFMLAMLDLHLHSPLAGSDFIRREADRLHVTCVTIRNLLRRAENRRWLRREGRMLSLSPTGTQRVILGMEAFDGLLEDIAGVERRARVDIPVWRQRRPAMAPHHPA